MPQERLPMRKIRDVLRLDAGGMSGRQIAAGLSVSKTTIQNCLRRAAAAGISWPLPDDLTDAELEARLYRPPEIPVADQRPLPDWAQVHREPPRSSGSPPSRSDAPTQHWAPFTDGSPRESEGPKRSPPQRGRIVSRGVV